MAYKRGVTSVSTTGLKTLPTTFTPIGYRIWVGSTTTANEGFLHYSEGGSDGTNSTSQWGYSDATLHDCGRSSTTVITHKINSGGTLVNDVVATHDSFTATGPKINVTTLGTTYGLEYEAWS